MNPYLENPAVWQDFHQAFLVAIRDEIKRQVGSSYYLKLEELLFIHELPDDEGRRFGRGDVTLTRPLPPTSGVASVTIPAPAQAWLPATPDVERYSYLQIFDRTRHEVVTVIELSSPSNKNPGPDRELYLSKRRQIQLSRVHLVELDLLRGGPRMPIQQAPDSNYSIMVSRWETRLQVDVWPISLRATLPSIPIPLLPQDNSVSLDLQPVLHRVYDAAGYGDFIYLHEPVPALAPADAEWAAQLLRG